MPDVSRSDSQLSDSSRPRVSFNRDVHVKRIGNGSAPRVVGALAADGSGRLQSLPVRRERPTRLSRQALAKEAHKVLLQADSVHCTSTSLGLPPSTDKFNTVPARRKKHHPIVATAASPGITRKRARVTRSNSDAANQKSDEDRTKFWSLDRLRSKKNKVKVTQSDTETPTIPSILSKKSHSDTEKRNWKNSDSEASSAKKKQLSPIIEATPRDDYFKSKPDDVVKNNKTLVTTKNKINQNSPKVPSRSRKVKTAPAINIQSKDSKVYKKIDKEPIKMETILHSSQTFTKPILTRGRTVDSMVRKLSQDRAGRGPPRVVSPLGLVTPGDDRKHNNNLPFSYTEPPYLHEDRFGGLIERDPLLGGGDSGLPTRSAKLDLPTSPTAATLHGDAQQVIYAEVVCNGGGNGAALTKQTVHTSVSQMKEDLPQTTAKPEVMEYTSEYKTNLGDYSNKETRRVESRGRADGMDARRNVQEEYRRSSPVRRNLMNDFEDVIEPVIKPWNDLSSRRDRLESRIESQRKDRLMSSRLNDKSYIGRRNDAVIDNGRKYPSNPRLDSEYNRREFLNSQLNHEKNKDSVDFGRSVDNIDKHAAAAAASASTAVVGKDKFTDSGIDIDYHNDMAANYPAGSKIITEVRSYHNQHERKSITPSIKYKSQPTLTNITKVDVNGHVQPGSDEEEEDDDHNEMFFYNQQANVDQIRAKRALKEAGMPADVVPSSSVLIRNYASGQNGIDKKDTGDGYRRRREERRDLDEDYTKRKSCLLSDAEESRRFLVEERRQIVDERAGVECGRLPEKVKKKSGPMDKVRALFGRGGDTKKKTAAAAAKKAADEEVDQLKARYTEYRGVEVQGPRAPSRLKNQAHTETSTLTRTRRERLATPSPSPSRPSSLAAPSNNGNASSGWFKSLDRLTSRKKTRAKMQQSEVISESDESKPPPQQKYNNNHNNNNINSADRGGNKSLRFFGDTDAESVRSHGVTKPTVKPLATLAEHPAPAQQTRYVPLRDASNRRYKSTNKLQVPRRRHHRSAGELATSSAESTTEGDSSQQSQRSVVYLHAATVGDIPGRTPSRTNRRARSREELSSTTGSNLTPQTRTVSRSISVLAPWKPRHYREAMEVHYENDSDRQLRATKPPKVPTNYKTTSSTLNRIKNNKEASTQHKSYNSLKRDSRNKDKENRKSSNSLSRNEYNKSSDSLLRNVDENGKRLGNGLNVSVGELSNGYRNGTTTLKKSKPSESERKRTELARSMSMPKDSKVKSGWFRLRKK